MVYTEIRSSRVSRMSLRPEIRLPIIYPLVSYWEVRVSQFYDAMLPLPNRITTSTNTKAHAH